MNGDILGPNVPSAQSSSINIPYAVLRVRAALGMKGSLQHRTDSTVQRAQRSMSMVGRWKGLSRL
jgi:hypothetical protein